MRGLRGVLLWCFRRIFGDMGGEGGLQDGTWAVV